ncbi:MAG: hypothetical protein Q9160_003815 [Pyrenula sp. 1 TL-2023]
MAIIAHIEQGKDRNVPVNKIGGTADHSFDPESYPKHVSQNFSEEEERKLDEAERQDMESVKVLKDSRRYLPCHYFDCICGSSTGASPNDRPINYGPAERMEIWQVARAATAVPLYFRPFDGPENQEKRMKRFVDGGLGFLNNPTLEGIIEVWGLNGTDSLHVVLSVGTARTNDPQGTSARENIKNLVGNGNDPQNAHNEVQRLSEGKFKYFRLNDSKGSDVAMDECKPKGSKQPGSETFKRLKNHFNDWVKDQTVANNLWECAVLLVQQRRARSKDLGPWETYSTGSTYSCPERGCDETLLSRHEMVSHMNNKHDENLEPDDQRIKNRRDLWQYQGG